MGRHAAPGEDEPLNPAVINVASLDIPRPPGARPLPQPRGRHSVEDDVEDDEEELAFGSSVEPKKRENATQADLRLLRTDAALRNRVIAAVIVPFVLYFVVLVSIGRVDAFAVWVWLPLITAGVTGGLLLDAAHRHLRADLGMED